MKTFNMESIPINWRLREQRYRLVGQKCPACNITFFYLRRICSNCGCRFDICCEEYKSMIDNILSTEIGC